MAVHASLLLPVWCSYRHKMSKPEIVCVCVCVCHSLFHE